MEVTKTLKMPAILPESRKVMAFLMLVYTPPAVDHRLDDGGEVIVGQDHGGSVLGHLSASDPHSHADVRRL